MIFPAVYQIDDQGYTWNILDGNKTNTNSILYVNEHVVDEIVKFHLFLQWFCNGDVDYWIDHMQNLKADLEYDHEKELRDVEQNATSDGYDSGHEAGYRQGHDIGYEDGYKQGYDEALKERSDGT